MEKDNLVKLQRAILKILREFIRICDENNLQYFLVEGSLLGAIRHKGFIPWDDDMDVAMPREDYEKFFQLCKRQLSDEFYVRYYKEYTKGDNSFPRVAQICDKSIHAIYSIFDVEEIINPYIDVLVLDGMPDTKLKQYLHFANLMLIYIFYKFATSDRIGMHLKRNTIQKIGIAIAKKLNLGRIINPKPVFSYLDKKMKKYAYVTSDTVVMFGSDYRQKQIMPKSYYGKGRECNFENISVVVPEKSESILTKVYGNYLQLPPLEEQKPKHGIQILD